jgi:hypothetical protein
MSNLRTITMMVLVAVVFAVYPCSVQGAETDPPALTPEALLGAIPALNEVPEVVPASADWWPAFPEFHVGTVNPGRAAGELFYVVQTFVKLDDQDNSRLVVTVILFDTAKAAHRVFVDRSARSAQGATVLSGPRLGDERRYFARSGSPSVTTMRYRVGPLTGRVSLFAPGPPVAAETVAKYGEALVNKLQELVAGTAGAPALPGDFEALMPPATAADQIGPLLGSAVVPIEAWALADTANDPLRIRDLLKEGGVTNLYLRRYGVADRPGQALEVVAFQFAEPEAATRWVRRFIRTVATTGPVFDPGDTGIRRAFTGGNAGEYELQFAKGRVVGQVLSLAPFADPDPALKPVVRQLAELWWRAMPLK